MADAGVDSKPRAASSDWKAGLDMTVASPFIYDAESNEKPCEKTFCAFGANCVAEADGRAHCQCPVDCPTVFTPVCGTDGTTYANHCLLRKKSCQDKKNTRVQHSGECGAQRTASRSRP